MGGRNFKMLKFRTMKTDAEAAGRRSGRRRTTRASPASASGCAASASTSCRRSSTSSRARWASSARAPSAPSSWPSCARQIPYYDLRTLVPPGITGWAQIRYPYAASLEEAREKLQYDL